VSDALVNNTSVGSEGAPDPGRSKPVSTQHQLFTRLVYPPPMAQESTQHLAKDILEALDEGFEREKQLEKADDEEKAVRYELALTRLKDMPAATYD
jgi:hypothetical protein